MTQETNSFFKSLNIATHYPFQGENSDVPYSSIFIPNADTSETILHLYSLRKQFMKDPTLLAKVIVEDAIERGIIDMEKIQTNPEKAILDLISKSEKTWLTLKFPIEKETSVVYVSIRAPGYALVLESLEVFLSQPYIDKLHKELTPKDDEWNNFDFETGEYKDNKKDDNKDNNATEENNADKKDNNND